MSYFSDHHHQEMQLFSHAPPSSSSQPPPWPTSAGPYDSSIDHLSLDLRLSISVTPIKPPSERSLLRKVRDRNTADALKWEAAEQIRLAAIEKAYAERVMDDEEGDGVSAVGVRRARSCGRGEGGGREGGACEREGHRHDGPDVRRDHLLVVPAEV
ncbi:UNVERIFIED_CONTAM: hypothetical protein Slati_0298100 [Sesamum latifolium]|uniref:Uncharacterized protein n=1 Tax=Sesamum latifolium TaxID=2727402 RepID=A0AAW2YE87_9LAMI